MEAGGGHSRRLPKFDAGLVNTPHSAAQATFLLSLSLVLRTIVGVGRPALRGSS